MTICDHIRNSLTIFKVEDDAHNPKLIKIAKRISSEMVEKYIQNPALTAEKIDLHNYLSLLIRYDCYEKVLDLSLQIFASRFSSMTRKMRHRSSDY